MLRMAQDTIRMGFPLASDVDLPDAPSSARRLKTLVERLADIGRQQNGGQMDAPPLSTPEPVTRPAPKIERTDAEPLNSSAPCEDVSKLLFLLAEERQERRRAQLEAARLRVQAAAACQTAKELQTNVE